MIQSAIKKQYKKSHFHKFSYKKRAFSYKYATKRAKISPAVANHRKNFAIFGLAGKELDEETGLYYYGARYLDPRTSRWLTGDPAIYQGDYIPIAPVNDDARKHNQNLPGEGGLFNTLNSHSYHYSFNNPVRYMDPDGRSGRNERRINGWHVAGALTIVGGAAVAIAGTALSGGAAVLPSLKAGGEIVLLGISMMATGEAVNQVQSNQNRNNRAVAASPSPSQPPLNNDENNRRNNEYRDKTRGANSDDRRQIDSVAREANIDRREFGDFIEETKRSEGRGASNNYTYRELQELAREFKELQ